MAKTNRDFSTEIYISYKIDGKVRSIVLTKNKRDYIREWCRIVWGEEPPMDLGDYFQHLATNEPGTWRFLLNIWEIKEDIMNADQEVADNASEEE